MYHRAVEGDTESLDYSSYVVGCPKIYLCRAIPNFIGFIMPGP